MRLITGLILGIVLTIGAAYVIDMVHSAPGADQQKARAMVNWDVVNANLQGLSTDLQEAWARLTGKARETDRKTGV